MNPKRQLVGKEYDVMSVVWDEGGRVPARRVHEVLSKRGTDRAETYQLIHRCIGKGYLEREEPDFVCHALIDRETIQVEETKRLVDRMFGGSAERLLVSLVDTKSTSQEEIGRLRALIKDVYQE